MADLGPAVDSERGTWRATPYAGARADEPMMLVHLLREAASTLLIGKDPFLAVVSRQDCDDLIALLQRVRERLPDGG